MGSKKKNRTKQRKTVKEKQQADVEASNMSQMIPPELQQFARDMMAAEQAKTSDSTATQEEEEVILTTASSDNTDHSTAADTATTTAAVEIAQLEQQDDLVSIAPVSSDNTEDSTAAIAAAVGLAHLEQQDDLIIIAAVSSDTNGNTEDNAAAAAAVGLAQLEQQDDLIIIAAVSSNTEDNTAAAAAATTVGLAQLKQQDDLVNNTGIIKEEEVAAASPEEKSSPEVVPANNNKAEADFEDVTKEEVKVSSNVSSEETAKDEVEPIDGPENEEEKEAVAETIEPEVEDAKVKNEELVGNAEEEEVAMPFAVAAKESDGEETHTEIIMEDENPEIQDETGQEEVLEKEVGIEQVVVDVVEAEPEVKKAEDESEEMVVNDKEEEVTVLFAEAAQDSGLEEPHTEKMMEDEKPEIQDETRQEEASEIEVEIEQVVVDVVEAEPELKKAEDESEELVVNDKEEEEEEVTTPFAEAAQESGVEEPHTEKRMEDEKPEITDETGQEEAPEKEVEIEQVIVDVVEAKPDAKKAEDESEELAASNEEKDVAASVASQEEEETATESTPTEKTLFDEEAEIEAQGDEIATGGADEVQQTAGTPTKEPSPVDESPDTHYQPENLSEAVPPTEKETSEAVEKEVVAAPVEEAAMTEASELTVETKDIPDELVQTEGNKMDEGNDTADKGVSAEPTKDLEVKAVSLPTDVEEEPNTEQISATNEPSVEPPTTTRGEEISVETEADKQEPKVEATDEVDQPGDAAVEPGEPDDDEPDDGEPTKKVEAEAEAAIEPEKQDITEDSLSNLPQDGDVSVISTKKRTSKKRRESFTDFLEKANGSFSAGDSSFSDLALKTSEYGDAIKCGRDVAKSDIAPTTTEFDDVQLKNTPPLQHLEIAPRGADYLNMELKHSEHGEAIKSGADVTKAEGSETEAAPEFNDVHLKNPPPLEKAEIAPRRASYVDMALKPPEPLERPKVAPRRASYICVALKPSEEGEIIKSGGDVVSMDSESVTTEVTAEFNDISLKKAPPIEKQPIAPRRASYIGVKLNESRQALKAGQKPEPKSSTPGKPAYAAFKLKSTGIADKLMPVAGTDKGGKTKSVVHKIVQAEKPSYAGFKLKSTGKAEKLMPGADIPTKSVAPTNKEENQKVEEAEAAGTSGGAAAFSGFKLKHTGKADTLIQKELERANQQASRNSVPIISDEVAAPAFAGFKLKSTGIAKKLVAGGDTGKERPSDSGKKAPYRVRVEPTIKASYAGFKLKSIRQADKIAGDGDAGKQSSSKTGAAAAFAGFKLKGVAPAEKPKDTVDEKQEIATGESAPEGVAERATPAENAEKETPSSKASFAGFKLKSTGRGAAVKSGGDVAKAENENGKGTTAAYSSIALKKAAPKPASIEASFDKSTAAYSVVQLKKATPKPDIMEEPSGIDASAYASVQLKKATPNASSLSGASPERPLYANTKLKAAAPIEKREVESRRASYVGVELKATGQGDNLKSGKDVEVPENKFETENEVTAIHLNEPTEREPEV